jgi:hypothetical protein
VPAERRVLMSDAMTSGGLLAAVPEDRCDDAPGVEIGRLVAGEAGRVSIA